MSSRISSISLQSIQNSLINSVLPMLNVRSATAWREFLALFSCNTAKNVHGTLRVVKTTRRILQTFCQIGKDFQRTKKRSSKYF